MANKEEQKKNAKLPGGGAQDFQDVTPSPAFWVVRLSRCTK